MEEVDNVKIEDFIELKEVNQEKKFSNVTFCNRNVSKRVAGDMNNTVYLPETLKIQFENTKRPLICVELPCKVDNPRRAIEALGGAQEIIDTFKNEGTTTYTRRRMNFKFRPDDPHCKPTMATGFTMTHHP